MEYFSTSALQHCILNRLNNSAVQPHLELTEAKGCAQRLCFRPQQLTLNTSDGSSNVHMMHVLFSYSQLPTIYKCFE